MCLNDASTIDYCDGIGCFFCLIGIVFGCFVCWIWISLDFRCDKMTG